MESIEHLRHLFDHDAWANREVLAVLREARPVPDASLRWLAHLVGTEHLWLARLRGATSPLPVWPDLTLEGLGVHLDRLCEEWDEYLGALPPGGLNRMVEYTNSKGEPWESRVGTILTHVILHAGHHRGQIASDLRKAGLEPPYTDYVHAVRAGLV